MAAYLMPASFHEGGLDGDDSEVDGLADVGDGRVGLEAHDLPALGVDGVQFALEAGVQHVLHEHSAQLRFVVGRTDNGDGVGTE